MRECPERSENATLLGRRTRARFITPEVLHPIPTILKTVLLLTASNVFMTFAWYAHLKNLSGRPWIIAALASWGIALFEYLLQVPANRIGYTGGLSAAQLKIIQEVITLSVFAPFAIFYLKEKLSWNYFFAALCMAGAVFFIVRDGLPGKKPEVVAAAL